MAGERARPRARRVEGACRSGRSIARDGSRRRGVHIVTEAFAGKVGWSSELIVIDGMMAFEDALALIKSAPPWIVISRVNGNYLYAFRSDELWGAPLFQAARNNPADRRTPIANVL